MRRLIPLLLAALSLTACSTPRYYKVVTMDHGGRVHSSWIAEGRVKRVEKGYTFKAVERRTGKPQRELHYPLGRPVRVSTAHTVIYPVEKPAWLVGQTPLTAADRAEDAANATR